MTQTPTRKRSYGKGRTLASKAEAKGNLTALGRLQELLGDGIDLSDVGTVKSAWLRTRTDDDGNVSVQGASINIAPSWEDGPAWPVVQPAKPIKVSFPKSPAKKATGWQTAVILPDPQIGYRQLSDGTLDPFHDEAAMDIALQVVEAERPDVVILLGDFLDFPSLSRFRQEPAFAFTTQAAIDRGHSFLAAICALAPDVRLIEGNHDARLSFYIQDNALAAFGLRPANLPDAWPVLSVPTLLRLDELGVTYVDGYPAGATWLNDNLACIHGKRHKSGGSTASLVADDERTSFIFGHVHRIETSYRTRNTRTGPKFSMAHTPGCLCRIDGAVPSTNGAIDVKGRPVRSFENWQQGLSIVRFEPGNGRFHLETVPIFEGWALHRGREYVAVGA